MTACLTGRTEALRRSVVGLVLLALLLSGGVVAAPHAAADMGTQVSSASSYATSRGGQVGISVLDRVTGRVYENGTLAHTQMRSASVPKILVAESLLRRARAGAITLSTNDRALMEAMVMRSDDAAMSSLYSRFGGLGAMHDVWSRYGLSELGDPPTAGYWGMFRITAHDIVKFYDGLMKGTGGLQAADRDYLISLMRRATATGSDGFNQYFGIPHALPNRVWGIKQGWMCCQESRRWLHTTGILGADNRFLVAVLGSFPSSTSYASAGETLTGVVQRLFPGGVIPSGAELRNPRGALQRLTEVAPGTVRVEGWTFDPDALARALKVHVYANGRYVGAGTADVVRTDVGAAHPEAGAAHGYRINVKVPHGTSKVCAYAINVGSGTTNPQLGGCQNVTVQLSPIGALERADVVGARTVRVSGWTLDREAPATSLRVHLYVDGRAVAGVTADGPRPDVEAARPGAGPLHGYGRDLVLGTGGSHRVCAYGINAPGTQGGNPVLGCVTVALPTGVRGALDSVTAVSPGQYDVAGWALDTGARTSPLRVHVYVDGTARSGVTADGPWAGYASVFPDAGPAHAYSARVTLTPGTHTVCTYGIGLVAGSGNPQIGCRTITV
jgi:hypothetical protein